jgi:signal transduction histidine kinase
MPRSLDHLPDARSSEELLVHIAELERELSARDKTIDALMVRTEGLLTARASDFTLFEQNLALEAVVTERTRDLREQHSKLERALADLRRVQSQLVQAQKLEAVGSLAAGVAHEINTPVQYVSDNVTFLGRAYARLAAVAEAAVAMIAAGGCGGAEGAALAHAVKAAKLGYLLTQAPRALDEARDGLLRIASIVGAFKEFSHQSTADKELVDLTRAVESTVTVARNEWKYVAEVKTHIEAGMPTVPALRNELNQVILNLIVNASHAIADANKAQPERKGTIDIDVRKEDGFAVIEVSDTGTGIPEAIRDRIFDPFFTTKPVGKGTGQGLAIAHDVVVERHQGRMEVRTEVGKGSTFVIKLPLDEASTNSPPSAAA